MFKFLEIKTSLGSISEKNILLEKKLKFEKGAINKKIGIKKRFISNQNQTTESLAASAIEQLSTKSKNLNFSNIISVTNTPSVLFPNYSHSIIAKLKKNINNTHCININSGCTGFVDCLIIANSFLKDKKNILIVTADTYSKYIEKNDRSIRPIFSDGASATVISYYKHGWKIKDTLTSTKINTEKYLCFNQGSFIRMNGAEVLNFFLEDVIPNIIKFTRTNKKTLLLVHQAGKIILDIVKKKINNSNIQIPTNYHLFGNLVSTSIPFLMKDYLKKFNNYERIIISGFGVGLSQSHVVLER